MTWYILLFTLTFYFDPGDALLGRRPDCCLMVPGECFWLVCPAVSDDTLELHIGGSP